MFNDVCFYSNKLVSFVSDAIAVLHGGRVVEQGTFEELLKLDSGYFRALIRK